jgi:hypothetical protein
MTDNSDDCKEVEDLLDRALAYRKAGNGEPLYANKQEILRQWVGYGARITKPDKK